VLLVPSGIRVSERSTAAVSYANSPNPHTG
jgi:hypothetical protein